MKLKNLFEVRYFQHLYRWNLGDYDLGEQDYDNEGTRDELIASVLNFANAHLDPGNWEASDISLGTEDADLEDRWIVMNSPYEDDYDYEDDENNPDGNELPDGRYVIGTYETNQ